MTVSEPVLPTGGRSAAVVAGLDIDRVAAAVATCPGVVGLHSGPYGAITTLLPGRRVPGVRVVDGEEGAAALSIALTARFGEDLADLGDRVRGAVAVHAPDLPVDVFVGAVGLSAVNPSTRP